MSTDGWQCPRCRRVWSPAVGECEPCNATITTRAEPLRLCPICGHPWEHHGKAPPGCPPPKRYDD